MACLLSLLHAAAKPIDPSMASAEEYLTGQSYAVMRLAGCLWNFGCMRVSGILVLLQSQCNSKDRLRPSQPRPAHSQHLCLAPCLILSRQQLSASPTSRSQRLNKHRQCQSLGQHLLVSSRVALLEQLHQHVLLVLHPQRPVSQGFPKSMHIFSHLQASLAAQKLQHPQLKEWQLVKQACGLRCVQRSLTFDRRPALSLHCSDVQPSYSSALRARLEPALGSP